MANYRKDRAAFHRALIALGWKPGQAYELTRRANLCQRLAVERCNRKLTPGEEKRDEQNDLAIRELAIRNGCAADVNGDPRGAVVKLQWRDNTKGGERYRPHGLGAFSSFGDPNDICVPTRGY